MHALLLNFPRERMSDVLPLVPYKTVMWEFLYSTTSDGVIYVNCTLTVYFLQKYYLVLSDCDGCMEI